MWDIVSRFLFLFVYKYEEFCRRKGIGNYFFYVWFYMYRGFLKVVMFNRYRKWNSWNFLSEVYNVLGVMWLNLIFVGMGLERS